MSKIFDALQLAERERELAADKEAELRPKSVFSPATAVLVQEQPKPAHTATSVRSPEEPSAGLQTASSSQAAARDSDGLDLHFGTIHTSVWTPDFTQTPALDTSGPLLEQFRVLRSRVHELRSKNRLKSVMISSGLPQEGKSFVAVNLALALASSKGNRVLLIDGDMRRASVHKVLGANAQPGLSEYLDGSASIDDVFQRGVSVDKDYPLPSAFSSLTFLGAGGDVKKAADLSGNRRFEELLRLVEPHFEWIIVDSSPVNLVADSVNLARACDGVLFIVRSGSTKLETAKRALEELKASKLLGVVLNAVKELPVSHGYYGYTNEEAGEERDRAGR